MLIPVGALVVLASLRFEGAVGRGWVCGLAVGVVVVFFLGVRWFVPDEVMFFGSEVSRRVRGQVEEFRKSGARDFLVVEGSSVAGHGCDPGVLEGELMRGGEDGVGVLQFSAQGANHFERMFMLEAFWRRLDDVERRRLREGRVVLLREVFDAYDREPLYLFGKESYRERAKVYMSPGYGWAAWGAFVAGMPEGLTVRERWGRGAGMAGTIVERVLMNRFGAGALSGMDRRERKRRTGAFFPLEGVKGKFDYDGAVAGMADWSEGGGDMVVPEGWLRVREIVKGRMGEWVDGEVFFAMPCLEGHRWRYQVGFGRLAGVEVLGPPGRDGMGEFLDRSYWFDGVHPTGGGAGSFSRWLAKRVLDSGGIDGLGRGKKKDDDDE